MNLTCDPAAFLLAFLETHLYIFVKFIISLLSRILKRKHETKCRILILIAEAAITILVVKNSICKIYQQMQVMLKIILMIVIIGLAHAQGPQIPELPAEQLIAFICIQNKCQKASKACEIDNNCVSALTECYKTCSAKFDCYDQCLLDKKSETALNVAKCAKENECDKLKIDDLKKIEPPTKQEQECVQLKCLNPSENCKEDSECKLQLEGCSNECFKHPVCLYDCIDKKNHPLIKQVGKCIKDEGCMGTKKEKDHYEAFRNCVKASCLKAILACSDPKCNNIFAQCSKECTADYNCLEKCIQGKDNPAALEIIRCGREHNCMV